MIKKGLKILLVLGLVVVALPGLKVIGQVLITACILGFAFKSLKGRKDTDN